MPHDAKPHFWAQGVRIEDGEAFALLADGTRRVVCSRRATGEEITLSDIPDGTALEVPAIGALCYSKDHSARTHRRIDVASIAETLQPRVRRAYLQRVAASRDDLPSMLAVLSHPGVPQRTVRAMLRRNLHLQPTLVDAVLSEDSPSLSVWDVVFLVTEAPALDLIARRFSDQPWTLVALCQQCAASANTAIYEHVTRKIVTSFLNPGSVLASSMLRHLIASVAHGPAMLAATLMRVLITDGDERVHDGFLRTLPALTLAERDIVFHGLRTLSSENEEADEVVSTALRWSSQFPSAIAQTGKCTRHFAPRTPQQLKRRALERASLRELGALADTTRDPLVWEVAAERRAVEPSTALSHHEHRIRRAAATHIHDAATVNELVSWGEHHSVLRQVIPRCSSAPTLESFLAEDPAQHERGADLHSLAASRLQQLELSALVVVSQQRNDGVLARAALQRLEHRDLLRQLAAALTGELRYCAALRLQAATTNPSRR